MDFKERKSLPLPRQFLCGQEREKIGCVAARQVSGVKGIFLDNGKIGKSWSHWKILEEVKLVSTEFTDSINI